MAQPRSRSWGRQATENDGLPQRSSSDDRLSEAHNHLKEYQSLLRNISHLQTLWRKTKDLAEGDLTPVDAMGQFSAIWTPRRIQDSAQATGRRRALAWLVGSRAS
jgi:hypothetical protein